MAGGVEQYIQNVIATPGVRSVLVVLDAEGDCAAAEGPRLLERCRSVASHVPTRIVMPCMIYENWLAASPVEGEERTPGQGGWEGPSALAWLKARVTGYKKTVHQARLTATLDFDLTASRCPSFGRFLRCVDDLGDGMIASCTEPPS